MDLLLLVPQLSFPIILYSTEVLLVDEAAILIWHFYI